MAFGVFMHRTDSIYQDSPAEHYQFPGKYLARCEALIGSWIIYYEPAKVRHSRGYFAIASIDSIIPDPKIANMYLAIVTPGSYLEFATSVPFREGNDLFELGLLSAKGEIGGNRQSAIRSINSADFWRIVDRGLDDEAPVLPRVDAIERDGFSDAQVPFIFDQPRERISILTSRIVRDRAFRRAVLRSYDQRCAITGLRLINGGGRAEVEAAHIRPVEANGPDMVGNGIALSGTAHWMFDRGLISLTDEYFILISRHANDQDAIRSFINPTGHAIVPERRFDQPHPVYLSWHRENCFKH